MAAGGKVMGVGVGRNVTGVGVGGNVMGVAVGTAVNAAAMRSSASRCISSVDGPQPARKTMPNANAMAFIRTAN